MRSLWHFAVSMALLAVIGAISFIFLPWEIHFSKKEVSKAVGAQFSPEYDLSEMGDWMNALELKNSDVEGRAVLISFFNFTDFESVKALSYLAEWHKNYRDRGLMVVGVYVPQMLLDHDKNYISRQIQSHGLSFPVALDFKAQIKQDYLVKNLPSWFLYDPEGRLVFSGAGRLNYGQMERMVAMTAKDDFGSGLFTLKAVPPKVETLESKLLTLNAGSQNSALDQPSDDSAKLQAPQEYKANKIYLQGLWQITPDAALNERKDGEAYLAVKFQAKRVHALMSSKSGRSVTVYVTLDDKPVPKSKAGPYLTYDSQGRSFLQIHQAEVYELFNSSESEGYVLKLSPAEADFGVYRIILEP